MMGFIHRWRLVGCGTSIAHATTVQHLSARGCRERKGTKGCHRNATYNAKGQPVGIQFATTLCDARVRTGTLVWNQREDQTQSAVMESSSKRQFGANGSGKRVVLARQQLNKTLCGMCAYYGRQCERSGGANQLVNGRIACVGEWDRF